VGSVPNDEPLPTTSRRSLLRPDLLVLLKTKIRLEVAHRKLEGALETSSASAFLVTIDTKKKKKKNCTFKYRPVPGLAR
jgi:hypothetical protein